MAMITALPLAATGGADGRLPLHQTRRIHPRLHPEYFFYK